MGLYVSVYKNIKETEKEDYSFNACVDHPSWMERIKNLKDGVNYEGKRQDVEVAYSYSSHSRFREFLIHVIDKLEYLDSNSKIDWKKYNSIGSGPFYEFINFSDCMGCIDWETSEKIFNDFKNHIWTAAKIGNPWQKEQYKKWMEIFDCAKDSGVVVFC